MERVKTVALFPGQGPSIADMAKCSLVLKGINQTAENRYFNQMGDVFKRVCGEALPSPTSLIERFHDPLPTVFAQPIIYYLSVATFEIFRSLASSQRYDIFLAAGHSAGEYTAYTVAEVMSFEEGAELIANRGKITQEACERNPGVLVRLIGPNILHKVGLLTGQDGPWGALFNAPDVLVVGCKEDQIPRLEQQAREQGAKRVDRLGISGPFHTPLFEDVARTMAGLLDRFDFNDAKISVLTALNAEVTKSGEVLKSYLPESLKNAVRWVEASRRMLSEGAEVLIEIGPGNSLTSLAKRNQVNIPALNFGNT